MSENGAQLSIAPNEAGFAIAGEVDAHTAPAISEAIKNWHHDDLTIDLSGVEFVDSSGLRTLIEAHQHFAELGGSLVISQPSPVVRRLFEISGVDQYLNVTAIEAGTADDSDLDDTD